MFPSLSTVPSVVDRCADWPLRLVFSYLDLNNGVKFTSQKDSAESAIKHTVGLLVLVHVSSRVKLIKQPPDQLLLSSPRFLPRLSDMSLVWRMMLWQQVRCCGRIIEIAQTSPSKTPAWGKEGALRSKTRSSFHTKDRKSLNDGIDFMSK